MKYWVTFILLFLEAPVFAHVPGREFVFSNSPLLASTTGFVFVAQSPESFAYDLDGNVTNDGRWTFTWDAENRLVSMVSLTNSPAESKRRLSFGYDYNGRRITKAAETWTGSSWTMTASNKFVYDGWNLLAELNATNNVVIRSYVWGLDLSGSTHGAGGVGGLLAVTDAVNGTHFFAHDGNGNVAALVKASDGTTSANYEYGPFGETLRATGLMASANPFRFSTKYQDNESDLLYYGYRYYFASTGRWLSRDPIGEAGGLNLNGFVGNSPLNAIDPLGKVETSINSPLGSLILSIAQSITRGISALGGLVGKAFGSIVYPSPTELPVYNIMPQTDMFGNRINWLVPRLNLLAPIDFGPQGMVQPETAEQILDVATAAANVALLMIPCKGLNAAEGTRALQLPATRGMAPGVLGETLPNGKVFLRPGLSRADQVSTLRHESVHAFFSPQGSGPVATFRQNLGQWGYDNSQLLRFTEEAMAETYGSGSLLQGLRHPLVNGYRITRGGLLLEGGVVGGGIFGAGYLGYQHGGGN